MDKLEKSFSRFEKAFEKYEEILKSPHLFSFLNKELIIEIATKRFEYTYESMWKALKYRVKY